MENAEVLEMTVKRVESILETRKQGKTENNTQHKTSLKATWSAAPLSASRQSIALASCTSFTKDVGVN